MSSPESGTSAATASALDPLTREVLFSRSRHLRDYAPSYLIAICFSFAAWHHDSGTLFFGVLAVVFSLHETAQRRQERRFNLLVEALKNPVHKLTSATDQAPKN